MGQGGPRRVIHGLDAQGAGRPICGARISPSSASISPEIATELADRLDRYDRAVASWETILLSQACREIGFAHKPISGWTGQGAGPLE